MKELIELGPLAIEILVVVGSVVWAAGKINVTTARLESAIGHLTQSLTKLELAVERAIEQQRSHDLRLYKLELQNGKESERHDN